ncbi:DUF1360 domain-containing protein [Lederbergia citrea]|uniref:DUF1360 domain-containing protein n=1 Tax=Lederbergia citrea TaxID=2833581 RepID=A0A942Z1C6_9BACI|nr:DUF1360 domain-containing protein [Lederbergia citrea]MBS4177384.1 DUF1360 domain-containing protein [Lederbergia citrea]MBS4204062.1 DUF1360 domain-containing protein [Lederbergia citrea]MBS4221353.1 DUF1360 domain-containing protein [Lederbergia citrea]
MDITWLKFFLISIATFRLTRLIVYDQITAFMRAPFMMDYEEINENGEKEVFIVARDSGLRGWIGELLSCYWCTGIWVATGLFFLQLKYPAVAEPIIVILALAGTAAIIETVMQTKNSI